eukprot:29112-Pelagococcus_subviridis.AAC.5
MKARAITFETPSRFERRTRGRCQLARRVPSAVTRQAPTPFRFSLARRGRGVRPAHAQTAPAPARVETPGQALSSSRSESKRARDERVIESRARVRVARVGDADGESRDGDEVPARSVQAISQIPAAVRPRGRAPGVFRGVHGPRDEPHVRAVLQGARTLLDRSASLAPRETRRGRARPRSRREGTRC